MLCCLTRFDPGDSGGNSGFAWICGVVGRRFGNHGQLLSLGLFGLSAGNCGRDGRFRSIIFRCVQRFFSLKQAGLRFAGLAGGDYRAVIRLLAGFNANIELNGRGLFIPHPFQRRHDRIFIGDCDAGGSLFVTLFSRLFFFCQPCLTGIETRLGFRRFARFQIQRLDLRFFLTVILHQWNIAGAHVRTSAALDAIKQMMLTCFLVLLPPAKPIELLR